MLDKIKSYLSLALTAVVGILAALLFAQRRKTESVESELATEKTNAVVAANDSDREAAKQEADGLVKTYEQLKKEYDESKLGGEGDL